MFRFTLCLLFLAAVANCLEEKKDEFRVGHDVESLNQEDLYLRKLLDHIRKSPVYKEDKECFEKLNKDSPIDFIIDVAPSPSKDEIDKFSAQTPMPFKFEEFSRSPSRTYFTVIQMFIERVTRDMNPEVAQSIIYDNGKEYYIWGRAFHDVDLVKKLASGGDFEDKQRNLKTLFPVPTKEHLSRLSDVHSSLGRLTKLALWSRDNGLPIVLNSERDTKPLYTVVITDGSSGVKIRDLVEDLSRTTVIDIGGRRFVNNVDWDETKQLMGVFSLPAPQKMLVLADTIRRNICLVNERQMSGSTF